MATRIRLRRVGRKKQPEYRIVVTDRAAARDGRFIETLGYYRPRTEPAQVEVDGERARAWLEKGATPSDTVRSLLKKAGVFGGGKETAAVATPVPESEADEAAAPEADPPAVAEADPPAVAEADPAPNAEG